MTRITNGARLGPYEILSRAGAGGMGEVWKGRDTRLNRTVAIKVLASDLASDSAAKQRMEREAQAVAALQHPHICSLFDIGHQNGTDFLVMEFLEGETLAQRLSRGKLPVDQALEYGTQIADALAAAHKAGIVHRDLKPGNIMLTKSGAKLLDFGLAKSAAPVLASEGTELATQQPITAAGTIAGTLRYMAPEQLEALPADARTDVFAAGCVLYEMLTGTRAFDGDTPASVIAAILDREPPPIELGADVMIDPALDGIIRTCLAKKRDDRWSSGHDLWLALERIGHAHTPPHASTSARSRPRGARFAWVLAALAVATALAFAYRLSHQPDAALPAPVVQSLIVFSNVWLSNPLLSPDGRYLALFAGAGGDEGRTILLRRLEDGETTWLPGTEHAMPVTWSPDSRSFAIVADGEFKAVDLATGATRTIGRAPTQSWYAASWSRDGTILFGGPRLRRLTVADGQVSDVYTPEPAVLWQSVPSFLPDGRTFTYAQESTEPARQGVFLGTLDSPDVTRLLAEPGYAVVSPRGQLLYERQNTLFAQRFDLSQKRVVDSPIRIASPIASPAGPVLANTFTVAGDLLIWGNILEVPAGRLTWFDRRGHAQPAAADVRQYSNIALSPDGQRVVSAEARGREAFRLFLIEPTRLFHAPLTTGTDSESDPVWSPDGREVAFASVRGVFKRRIDQPGRTMLLNVPVTGVEDWTRDGQFLILLTSPQSIGALPLRGEPKLVQVVQLSSVVDEPRVSPDGQWLAYSSNETGQWEVYVQPFMRAGGRVRISANGGSQPRWRADGRELFYLALDATMMSVDTTAPTTPSAPRKLFQLRLWVNPVEDQFEVTGDGQRFLVIVPEGQLNTPLTLLSNWPSLLNAR